MATQPRYIVYQGVVNGGLYLWDTQTNTLGSKLDAGNSYLSIDNKGCTDLAGTVSFFRGDVRIVRLDMNTLVVTTVTTNANYTTGGAGRTDICCSPDGSVLYVVGKDGRLAALDSTTGTVLRQNTTVSFTYSNCSIVTYDGTRVFTSAGSAATTTKCFDTATLTQIWSSAASGSIRAGTRLGKLLTANASVGGVQFLDANTGGVLPAITPVPYFQFFGLTITNDESALYWYVTKVDGFFYMIKQDITTGTILSQAQIAGVTTTNISDIKIDTANQKIYHGGANSSGRAIIQVFDIATLTDTIYLQAGTFTPFTGTTGFASVFAPDPTTPGETPGSVWGLNPPTPLPAPDPPPPPPTLSPWSRVCSGALQPWIVKTPGQ